MIISTLRIIGALGVVVVTTAAVPMCNKDGGTSASAQTAAAETVVAPSTATTAATGGSGLPADFPLPPGLSACRPLVMGREVECVWHNVDQHAMYTYYLAALPKAGYTLLRGAQEAKTPTFYLAAMGFKKGGIQGAVTINGGKDLTIQVLYPS